MVIVHALLATVVALLVGVIFAAAFRRPGPWASLPAFFLILFLAAWAGGIWITPVGPLVWGVYWMPFLVVGLIFALPLAAVSPAPPSRYDRHRSPQRAQAGAGAAAVLEGFFWLLVVFLAAVNLFRYVPLV